MGLDKFSNTNKSQHNVIMPAISMFYGVVIYIYFFDNKKHNKPHIHVKYAGSEVVLGLPDGEIMEGGIPNNKMKLVEAWIEIHKEDLLANWELAVNGQEVFKIEPLK